MIFFKQAGGGPDYVLPNDILLDNFPWGRRSLLKKKMKIDIDTEIQTQINMI